MANDETRTDRKYDGVRVVCSGELDGKTPQAPGMGRAAAITLLHTATLPRSHVAAQPCCRAAMRETGNPAKRPCLCTYK